MSNFFIKEDNDLDHVIDTYTNINCNDYLYSPFYFLKNERVYMIQAASFIALLAYLMHNTYEDLKDGEYSAAYITARCAGMGLKLCTPSLFMPLSRVTFTKLSNNILGKYLGLSRPITDHKIFAAAIFALSSIHIAAHHANDPQNFMKQPGITGVVMTLALITAASLFLIHHVLKGRIRYSYSGYVLRPHAMAAVVFLGTYFFHTCDLRLLNSFVLFTPFMLDRLSEKFIFKYRSSISKIINIPGTDYFILRLKKPPFFTSEAGQWLVLKCTTIKPFEKGHPFTIANFPADNDYVELLIRKVGAWTAAVAALDQYAETEMEIIGPFGNSIRQKSRSKPFTAICSGSGMSIAMAIIAQQQSDYRLKPRELLITQRDPNEFMPLLKTLESNNFLQHEKRCMLHLYLTGHNSEAQNMLNGEVVKYWPQDSLKIKQGRPNLQEIITADPETATQKNLVVVCGNAQIIKSTVTIARKFSRPVFADQF